jgi:hypothetical protein
MKTTFVEPNFTELTPVKPVPESVTALPPTAGPEFGVTPETTGTGFAYVKPPGSALDVPPAFVTVTATFPAACAGATKLMLVFVVDCASTTMPPIVALVLKRPVPERVTRVPPARGPDVGDALESVGTF